MASSLSMPPAVGADEVRVQIFWVQQKRRGDPVELINKSECTYALATSFRIVKLGFFGSAVEPRSENTIFCSSADLRTIFNADTMFDDSANGRAMLTVHATMDVATFRSTFTRVAEMRDTLAAWQSAGRLTLVLDHGALTEELAFLDA